VRFNTRWSACSMEPTAPQWLVPPSLRQPLRLHPKWYYSLHSLHPILYIGNRVPFGMLPHSPSFFHYLWSFSGSSVSSTHHCSCHIQTSLISACMMGEKMSPTRDINIYICGPLSNFAVLCILFHPLRTCVRECQGGQISKTLNSL
jgi:hypothetical protein